MTSATTTPGNAGEEDRVRIVKQIAVLAASLALSGATAAAALTLSPKPKGATADRNARWLYAFALANHRR